MTDKLFIVLKAQMQNRLLGAGRRGGTKKGRIAMVLVMGLAFLVIAFYCFMLGMGFCSMGLANYVPIIAVMAVTAMTLFFTILKTNGMLFGCKDNEMLCSLPLRHGVIAASRFIGLYLSNLLTTLFIMMPLGASLVVYASPQWYFYPLWLLGVLLLPVVPTAVGGLLGAGLTAISTRFRYSNIVSSVLVMLFVVVMVVIPYSVTGSGEEGILNALAGLSGTLESVVGWYPLAGWFGAAVVSGDVLAFLALTGVCVLVFVLMVALLSRFYFALDAAIVGQTAGRRYTMTQQRSSSAVLSIAKKEWARFIGTPVYFTNLGIGAVMSLLMCGYLSFSGLRSLEAMGLPAQLTLFLPLAIPFFLGMSSTSCVSLSLEGKNLWILQSSPLSTGDVMGGKILMALSLTIPASLIASALFIPYTSGVLGLLLLFVYPLTFCVFSAVFGAFVNLKIPNFTWETEVRVVKQSASAMIGMLGCMVLAVVPALLCLLASLPALPVMAGASVLLLVVSGILWTVIRRTPLLFEE